MGLEDEEMRREKRAQMAARTHEAQAARDPNSSTSAAQSSGAMDALLDKLRAAGPTKREARRRQRLRPGAAARKASATMVPDAGTDSDKHDDTAILISSDSERTVMSPDITVTSADQTHDDSLTKRTEEMLMRIRIEGGDASSSLTKGNTRDMRKERRRRNGSNVSMSSSSAPTLLSLMTGPPIPAIPNMPLSPGGLAALGSAEGDDQVARAKSALMAMRRGSDAGSIDSTTSNQPTPKDLDPAALKSQEAAITDEEGDPVPSTPTTS